MSEVSYILNKISLMEPEAFFEFMNTIVYNGDKSIVLINEMIIKLNLQEIHNENLNFQKYSNFARLYNSKNGS
jgi:hypothetical protein